jgi:hypothetical protein
MTAATVDDLAQLCFTLACNEACEIMKEIRYLDVLSACEIVALLTILRPVRERLRQPAPVLTLVPRQAAKNQIEGRA